MNLTLYPNSIVDRLLGSLVQDTELCLNSKYPLEKEEFLRRFHKIIYVSLYNLATKGVKSATTADIGEFVGQWEEPYTILEDNNYINYLEDCVEMSDPTNFKMYYNEFRKYSCLREYKENGFDISKFYDETKEEKTQLENLASYTMNDIVNYFEKIQAELRHKYILNKEIKEYTCGEGWDNLLEKYKEDPLLGAQLSQPILNNLFRGWCKGHLLLRGAPSSFGKTLMGAMDLVMACSLKLWSNKEKCFIDNPYYRGKGALIHSEQKSKEEIQPRINSIIAGIPYYIILDGVYDEEQQSRLSEAGRISKESDIKIINYPNFTSTGIREELKNLSARGYEYIVQDYVWNNSYIISDMKKTLGITNVSEPNALLHFVNTLKLSAEEFNIGIYTSMQLNDSYKLAKILDEGCLYASKSVKTKLDNGVITTTPREKELKQIEGLIVKWNKEYGENKFGDILYPNMLNSCFKTRYGRFGENIKVWSYIDKGTGEVIDMFATTSENKPIKIDPLYIETNKKIK